MIKLRANNMTIVDALSAFLSMQHPSLETL